LHTKLLQRKKAKLLEEKKEKAARLKVLVTKMNEQLKTETSDPETPPLEDGILNRTVVN